jgi:hypothetical protein
MVLYAADLSKLDAPTKKLSKKKQVEAPEETPVEVAEKPKRVLSEKQKEALLKGQETRRLKKEALQKEKEEHEALEKKLLEAQKKPRKRKVLAIEAPVEEIEVATEEIKTEEVIPKKKRTPKPKPEPIPESIEAEPKPKRAKKENEPPVWFKKYVEDVQKEKASIGGEVSKKQENIIKTEALKVAKKSWQSGFTRDRVQGEVDNHMNRMYGMIFGR